MVKNVELFKKIMAFSRELRFKAFSGAAPGDGPDGFRGFPPHSPGRKGMCPPPPPVDEMGRPFIPHPMGEEGRPPFPPPRHEGKGRWMTRERLLVIISEFPDGVRQKDLAENAGINASSTSELVNRLEDDGYLIRTVDETDKRATLLKLTDMGTARANEISDERESSLQEIFGRLTDEEKETLSDILDKLLPPPGDRHMC